MNLWWEGGPWDERGSWVLPPRKLFQPPLVFLRKFGTEYNGSGWWVQRWANKKIFTLSDRDSATFKMASALAFALASIAFASPGGREKKQEGLKISRIWDEYLKQAYIPVAVLICSIFRPSEARIWLCFWPSATLIAATLVPDKTQWCNCWSCFKVF